MAPAGTRRTRLMINYLIAKYVDDLARNEPSNVGVIVTDGVRVVARFDGEDDAGAINLNRIRHRITGSRSYRAWVQYWRAVIDDPSSIGAAKETTPAELIDLLVAEPSRDFYLEQGGTILLDADERSLDETARELYEQMVREPDPPSPLSLQDKSRQALSVAGAPLDDVGRFKSQFTVPLDIHGVTVDHEVSYAVMNGEWHYLQEMPFDPGKPRVSRKEASHCAVLFEHAGWNRDNSLILYDGTDLSESSAGLLEMLQSFAPVVDVDHTDAAAKVLHDSLNLDDEDPPFDGTL
jgi:hypothetical protein